MSASHYHMVGPNTINILPGTYCTHTLYLSYIISWLWSHTVRMSTINKNMHVHVHAL